MFAKSRKDKLVDQAQGLVHDLSEAIAPHVDKAREELAPRLSDARDAVAPRLNDARDAVAPRLSDARDAVAPRLSDARDAVAPRLAEARDAVTPHLVQARDRVVDTVGPTVQTVVDNAREQAVATSSEAARRGSLAAAALKGEPVKKKGGKGKYVLLIALAGAGAFVAKKLTGGGTADNWQSSYTPTPASTPSSTSTTPAAASSDAPVSPSDQQVDLGRVGGDDPAGATPGETIADSAVEPHPVTTPDSPAETIDVSEVKDPEKP